MGSVWKAMDLRLERTVALKLLKDADESRRRAMLAEAKTACQLHHPNIATVFEAGEVDGTSFIAMEFVEGRTLRAFVHQRHEAPWLRAVAAQACAALAHAHARGVVHRDIKPENLVLTPGGALKILDFGIARRQVAGAPAGDATGAVPAADHHATLVERTAPGYSQGTPAYMSPEQANGYDLGPAWDTFPLGVVPYGLATGHHPFLRGNLVETLCAVVKDEPALLAAVRPDLDAGFSAMVGRLMAKLPSDRFPSLAEAVTVLDAVAPASAAAPAQRVSRWPLAAGLGVLLLVGGGGAYTLMRKPTDGVTAARAASATDFGKGRRVLAVLPPNRPGRMPRGPGSAPAPGTPWPADPWRSPRCW